MTESRPRRHFLGHFLAGLAGLALPFRPRPAQADPQSETPYLGEIMLVPFGYAPQGWALCNGQLLPINSNQALFSLLGTTYGGNGVTTFALPDLRERVAIHRGQGPGLTSRTLGDRAGEVAHALTLSELPAHTHQARASSLAGTTADPSVNVVPARNPAGIGQWGPGVATAMSAAAITSAGGNQPHANQQPYLTLNFVIALQGVYPSAS